MKKRKKIIVVTSSRAEYGLLYWVLKRLKTDPNYQLDIFATGAHLLKEFGETVNEIVNDGYSVTNRINILDKGDDNAAMAKSIGKGIIRFTKTFDKNQPDIVLVLGDRFEIFAAVSAARILNIPIVHISGGDTTEGSIDNVFRHTISLMSSLHFVKLKAHKNKLINLGINPCDIHVVGYMGLENLAHLRLFPNGQLEKILKAKLLKPLALVTFHPVTNPINVYDNDIDILLNVLKARKELYYIFTGANEDSGGRIINQKIFTFCQRLKKRTVFIKSLGREIYLNIMAHSDVMIGNTSSGILESAFFNVPVVNIQPRQHGRKRNKNVIDCQNQPKDLNMSIDQALSSSFKQKCRKIKNIYEVIPNADISKNIVKKIRERF